MSDASVAATAPQRLPCLYSPTRSPPLSHPRRYPGSAARPHRDQRRPKSSLTRRQLLRSVTSTSARLVRSSVTPPGSCRSFIACAGPSAHTHPSPPFPGTCSSTVSKQTAVTTPALPTRSALAVPTRLSSPRPAAVNMFPALSLLTSTPRYVVRLDTTIGSNANISTPAAHRRDPYRCLPPAFPPGAADQRQGGRGQQLYDHAKVFGAHERELMHCRCSWPLHRWQGACG